MLFLRSLPALQRAHFCLKTVTLSHRSPTSKLVPSMSSLSIHVARPLFSNMGLPSLTHGWICLPSDLMTRRTDKLLRLGFLWYSTITSGIAKETTDTILFSWILGKHHSLTYSVVRKNLYSPVDLPPCSFPFEERLLGRQVWHSQTE